MENRIFFIGLFLAALLAQAFGLPGVFASDQLSEPVVGQADAPVLMEEFSDFECPFCKRFHDQTWPLLKKEFIDTGKVSFVYRDLPLSFHENAYSAALAGQCAHEQGKFWEMHDKIFKLFENRGMFADDFLGELVYKKLAQEIGLNSEQFNECLDAKKYAPEVEDDLLTAQEKEVNGTPTFFINEKKFVGAQPYNEFRKLILKELGEPYTGQAPIPVPMPMVIQPDNQVVEEAEPNNPPVAPQEDDKRVVDQPAEIPRPEPRACNDGCTFDGKCMGASSRFIAGGKPAYCGLELEIKAQEPVGYFCQNNFECLSNACSNGTCVDLQKEIQETKGILQQVLGWLSGLFGFKPK